MNQIKIGKFIAECRKRENLTQSKLAEILGITDRAVSKWENGRSMPDSSIMLPLCNTLKISVNDLLSGEVVEMKNYNEEAEKNLLKVVREKEESDKRLLTMEIVLGVVSIIPLIASIFIVSLIPLKEWIATVIVIACLIPLLIATPFAIKIEQKAGYYVCQKCGHRYIPKYNSVFMAMHMGRTRYMKCPECKKYSWQKKVIRKEG